MIPASLGEWTYEAVLALCAVGQSESERHDFKLGLPDPYTLTKLCCAFANSAGGFVVVGVRDRQPFEVLGIDPDNELFSQFVGKVRASPDIQIEQPKPIAIPGSKHFLYVFEIKRSQRRPHLPTKEDDRVFWKRQGPSCVQMTLEEIRYQMNDYEEKREKLALLMFDLRSKVEALNGEARLSPGAYSPSFGQSYSLDIVDRVMVEAYSFLKADPAVFKALDSFKLRMSQLNAAKQRLITEVATKVGFDFQRDAIRIYHDQLKSTMHEITTHFEQIRHSITQIAGIGDLIATL